MAKAASKFKEQLFKNLSELKSSIWFKRTLIFSLVLGAGLVVSYWPLVKEFVLNSSSTVVSDSTPPNAEDTQASRLVGEERKDLGPNFISIPAIGVKAPIQFPLDSQESAFQVALERGVGHYPGTPLPGQPGNIYLFAHSSDFAWKKGDYKTIFARLPELKIGDTITVTNNESVGFNYKVTEKKIIDPKDFSVLGQDYNKYQITLQTSYPLGTARQRYIVVAEIQPPQDN